MSKNPNLQIVGFFLVFLMICFSMAKAQEGTATPPAPTALEWDYFHLRDFSGGLNSINWVGELAPNQARELFNLVIINGQPTFRPGYASYATITANRGIRGIFGFNRSLDNKRLTFAADSGFMWADTGTGTFYAIPGSGTIDSTKDVQAVVWEDTLLYLDKVQDPKKTDGKGTYDGTIVDTGIVYKMYPLGSYGRDRDSLTGLRGITEDAPVIKPQPDSNFATMASAWVGTLWGIIGGFHIDTSRYLFKPDLTGFEAVDSIKSYLVGFYISANSNNVETLVVRRITSAWNYCCQGAGGVTWNTQPSYNTRNIDILVLPTNPTPKVYYFEVGPVADSMIKGYYSNHGFVIQAISESKIVSGAYLYSADHNTRKPIIIPTVQLNSFTYKGHANSIIDTLSIGVFPSNDLAGFFIYFVRDSVFRQITSNNSDSGRISFKPPLINPKFAVDEKEQYRIHARPSSDDKIDTGHVDSLRRLTPVADSIFKVWIGEKRNILSGAYNKNTYYLSVKAGKGQGDYLILENGDTAVGADTLDWFKLFLPTKLVFDNTTKWEIFKPKFPPCADVFAKGNRIFYMQANKPYVWFSEANNTAQVEPDNFYIMGGERLNALFSLSATALSGYSDQQTPLFAASNSSIWGLYSNNPDTDIPQRVSAGVGISFKNSIVYLPEGGVDWLNPKGQAYRFNGRDVQKLSLTIPDRFDAISTLLVGNITGFHYEGIDYWWVTNSDYSTGLGYALSVANNAWSTHDVPFRTAFRQFVPSDSIPVLIGAVNTGKIFKFGRAVNDTGLYFQVYYTTPWLDLGNPAITKEFRDVTMGYRGFKLTTLFPSLVAFVANSPLGTGTVADSIAFDAGLPYQDYVERKSFKPGAVIGKYVSFRVRAQGQFKLGELSFKYRTSERF